VKRWLPACARSRRKKKIENTEKKKYEIRRKKI
jgi:hypothetical protein